MTHPGFRDPLHRTDEPQTLHVVVRPAPLTVMLLGLVFGITVGLAIGWVTWGVSW